MAVANLPCAGIKPHTLHRAAVGGQDQIKAAQIQRLRGEWVERQKVPMVRARQRQLLQQGGVQWAIRKAGGQTRWRSHQREEFRLREQRRDAFRYALATAAGYKPVVNDGHPHALESPVAIDDRCQRTQQDREITPQTPRLHILTVEAHPLGIIDVAAA